MSAGKLCKFGCGTELTWDNGKKKFVEPDGKEHTRERCESLKTKPQAKAEPNTDVLTKELTLAINHLANAIEALAKSRIGN